VLDELNIKLEAKISPLVIVFDEFSTESLNGEIPFNLFLDLKLRYSLV
jgi:hypothetical protein